MSIKPPDSRINPLYYDCNNDLCHPNAPSGAGGCGTFSLPGSLGCSSYDIHSSLPHPLSPASRYLTHQEICKVSTADFDKQNHVISGLLYPLTIRATADYHTAPRSFGSPRDYGKRRHAAIDFWAPKGTIVRAVADGVVRDVYYFYSDTWAIEINHGGFIVIYGEVDKHSKNIFVAKGDKVKRGDKIGMVGKLVGIHVASNMLHLEMYSTVKEGKLTDKNKPPYFRRSDLFDPTKSIDIAEFTPTPTPAPFNFDLA